MAKLNVQQICAVLDNFLESAHVHAEDLLIVGDAAAVLKGERTYADSIVIELGMFIAGRIYNAMPQCEFISITGKPYECEYGVIKMVLNPQRQFVEASVVTVESLKYGYNVA